MKIIKSKNKLTLLHTEIIRMEKSLVLNEVYHLNETCICMVWSSLLSVFTYTTHTRTYIDTDSKIVIFTLLKFMIIILFMTSWDKLMHNGDRKNAFDARNKWIYKNPLNSLYAHILKNRIFVIENFAKDL